jgi:hypothetical protein
MNLPFTSFLAIIVGLAVLAGDNLASARTVVCESNDRETRYCAADTRGGVRLATQYSKSGCYQGRTWGYDRRGVWVSNGCRAQFDIGDERTDHYSSRDSNATAAMALGLIGARDFGSQRQEERDDDYEYQPRDDHRRWRSSRTITCESRDDRDNYCRANLRHARVDIVRQLSRKPCRYGRNWGWDGGGIWVQDGCRAVFSVE